MPLLTHIPEILEEHFEELSFLLHFRAIQIASAKMLYRQLIDLDDRIEGHIAGLFAVPDGAIALAENAFAGKDPLDLRAAAYLLLSLEASAYAQRIVDRLVPPGPSAEPCPPAVAAAIVDGLLMAPAPQVFTLLRPIVAGSAALPAAYAAHVLSQHSPRDVSAHIMGTLLTHADPAVRTVAWHAAAHLAEPRPAAQYRAGIADAVPAVRDAALLAAAWAGFPVLDACRPFLRKPAEENLLPLRLWAVLAPPDQLSPIDLAKAAPLGPSRFGLLACSGSPGVIPHLIAGMRLDPASAAGAAEAFARLTNYLPPAAPPPPGDKEATPVPDADAAQRYWDSVEPALGKMPRIHRGESIEPPPSSLLNVDCAAREDILLRHAADNRHLASPGVRWAFPQRATAVGSRVPA